MPDFEADNPTPGETEVRGAKSSPGDDVSRPVSAVERLARAMEKLAESASDESFRRSLVESSDDGAGAGADSPQDLSSGGQRSGTQSPETDIPEAGTGAIEELADEATDLASRTIDEAAEDVQQLLEEIEAIEAPGEAPTGTAEGDIRSIAETLEEVDPVAEIDDFAVEGAIDDPAIDETVGSVPETPIAEGPMAEPVEEPEAVADEPASASQVVGTEPMIEPPAGADLGEEDLASEIDKLVTGGSDDSHPEALVDSPIDLVVAAEEPAEAISAAPTPAEQTSTGAGDDTDNDELTRQINEALTADPTEPPAMIGDRSSAVETEPPSAGVDDQPPAAPTPPEIEAADGTEDDDLTRQINEMLSSAPAEAAESPTETGPIAATSGDPIGDADTSMDDPSSQLDALFSGPSPEDPSTAAAESGVRSSEVEPVADGVIPSATDSAKSSDGSSAGEILAPEQLIGEADLPQVGSRVESPSKGTAPAPVAAPAPAPVAAPAAASEATPAAAAPAAASEATAPTDASAFSDESEVIEPESAEGDPERDLSLQEIDRALADDVDSLLNGDFEAVAEVLNDVFDEEAMIVEEPEEDPEPAMPQMVQDDPSAAPLDDQPAPADGVGEPIEGEPPAPPVAESPFAAQVAEPSTDSPRTEPATSVETSVAPGAPGTPGAPADSKTTSSSALSELLPTRADSIPEPEPESAAAEKSSASEPEGAVEPVTAVAEASGEIEAKDGAESVFSPIESVITRGLSCMNYPLRLLPPGVRPVVDWIALSLVFWVPIVWVIALFVIGR